jgi:hypothetical protein
VTHKAQVYINTNLFPGVTSKVDIEKYALNNFEATSLLKHLRNDSTSYLYSAIISIADATVGIRNQSLTWATVKLYYATYYALRSLLAMNGICIFYIKTTPTKSTPFILNAFPGNMAKKSNIAQTHKLVLTEFTKYSIEPLILSQEIDGKNPLDWMIDKREEANYKNAKFIEPLIPNHFKIIVNLGVRRVIKEYLLDSSYLYSFDSDHAILAYPLKVVQIAYNRINLIDRSLFPKDDVNYLCKLFNDQNGPIPEIFNWLKNII